MRRLWIGISLVLLLILAAIFSFTPPPALSPALALAPPERVHWHAHLIIQIDGKNILIPAGAGIEIGQNADHEVSGVDASPVHTHDFSGVLHVEVLDYSRYKEKTTLSYFFEVWQQPLTDSCVLFHCTSASHQWRFFVNGQERFDWLTYKLQDNDRVELTYERLAVYENTRF